MSSLTPYILTGMSLCAWLVKQVFAYSDWLPTRRLKKAAGVFVAVVAILMPSGREGKGRRGDRTHDRTWSVLPQRKDWW